MAEPRPIFVIGSPRSGTTLLRLMLDAHPRISCGPETSFLLDMQRIVTDHWSHIDLYGFSEADWHERIARFFSSFQTEYAQRRGKARWADKTPHYTPQVRFLHALFPNAQFVHIVRDGRDVVASHCRRWGYREALRGIKRWRRHVSAARAFGEMVSAEQYHELRYEDLVGETEATLRELLAFLDEPWSEQMLAYDSVPHDVKPRYAALTATRRQGASSETVYRSRVGSWRREPDPVLKCACYLWAGSLLRDLGYWTGWSVAR